MDRVFPALRRKFRGNRQLVRWARELYQGHGGEPSKSPRPYVEVTCNGIDHDYDTFSTSEPVYDLTFTIWTKDREGTRCGEIMGELRDTFKDCDLPSGEFDTVRMLFVGSDGPMLDPESATYKATQAYQLHISLKQESPVEAML